MSIDLAKDNEMREVFRKAFTRSMMIIENKVKRRTPVDKGHLRRSVHYDLENASDTRIEFYVGSNLHYAPHVEYGWEQERETKGGRKYTMRYSGAFMFQRGIEASRSSVENVIQKAVQKALRGSTWRFLKDYGAKVDF